MMKPSGSIFERINEISERQDWQAVQSRVVEHEVLLEGRLKACAQMRI